MAQGRGATGVEWFSADPRAILPLDDFHIPHGLKRTLRKETFRLTLDQDFPAVIRACAQPRPYEQETWINQAIVEVYLELHRRGHAHSVEAWAPQEGARGNGPAASAAPGRTGKPLVPPPASPCPPAPGPGLQLAGGLYGVAIGGAFFGESMFSRSTDASKVCLVHLVEHLKSRGFILLDTQFHNPHLTQFGLREIPAADYLRKLQVALAMDVRWGE